MNRWSRIEARIEGLRVRGAGGMMPFQSEGMLQQFPYAFRYRGGAASLCVGEVGKPDSAVFDSALYAASMRYGDQWGGGLSPEEFETLMLQLVVALRPLDFSYRFPGLRVKMEGAIGQVQLVATEEEQVYYSRGATAEQAYQALLKPSPEFADLGLTEQQQHELIAMQKIQLEPVEQDFRRYPVHSVIFRVSNEI